MSLVPYLATAAAAAAAEAAAAATTAATPETTATEFIFTTEAEIYDEPSQGRSWTVNTDLVCDGAQVQYIFRKETPLCVHAGCTDVELTRMINNAVMYVSKGQPRCTSAIISDPKKNTRMSCAEHASIEVWVRRGDSEPKPMKLRQCFNTSRACKTQRWITADEVVKDICYFAESAKSATHAKCRCPQELGGGCHFKRVTKCRRCDDVKCRAKTSTDIYKMIAALSEAHSSNEIFAPIIESFAGQIVASKRQRLG